MENMIQVKIHDEVKTYPTGVYFEKIAQEYQKQYDNTIALVVSNGKIRELGKRVYKDCEVSFLTLKDDIGHKTYVRTALFVLLKAIYDVIGTKNIEKIKVEFSIGKSIYVSGTGSFLLDQKLVEQVKQRMRELVQAHIPIEKTNYPTDEAIALFKKYHMEDKEMLFRFRRSSTINVYNIEDFHDYFYGYMLPNTSYIKYFDLELYENGFVINLPDKEEPTNVSSFKPRTKLFQTLLQANEWGNSLGIDTVGDLNNHICAGNVSDLILVQEALQERRIGEIAKAIVAKKGVKFVMIAGPSSSGKTTFSHRLSIQLRTMGLNPHPIAVDDYFVDRELTPRNENGDYNFECLEAIDVQQFNEDMVQLLEGKTVELPIFNFKTGIRESKGRTKKLGADDILVIEGIHCLNDKMSESLPVESKFKIYISALTSLNIDEHNRIPTTDVRLLRRMVRDARTRGASAERTIEMWPSVRKGEEENIFPYQESADVMFNSALIYELAVIKQFAEPLLFRIQSEDEGYFEAKRLLKFLEYFLGVSSEDLPKNSIVREFVGGSCFHV